MVRKQTRTISFDRVNHHLFLSQFLLSSQKPARTKWIALATQAFNSHHRGKIILLSIHVYLIIIFFFGIDLFGIRRSDT